jgi:hypothetical protein
MSGCQWATGCPQPAEVRDHCMTHYKKLWYHHSPLVTTNLIDATPTRRWISKQLRHNRTYHSIAARTGVDDHALKATHTGATKLIQANNAARILALPLRPSDIGCTRRIQALQRLGHPIPTIARHTGIPHGTLKSITEHRGHVQDNNAEAIAATYPHMSLALGNPRIARLATKHGHHGPWAWTNVDIDNPQAQPDPRPQGPEPLTLANAWPRALALQGLSTAWLRTQGLHVRDAA